ncbi:MAG: HEAT repeat domain-containing protein [Anaerolineae bacterium]|nr:HEAT repeat domain-containing protein [Anaerolineae bacterium]
MDNAPHIFISYARRDGRSAAEQLERDLSAAGHRVWWDKRSLDPDQDFTAELERAIDEAESVVCCVTPDTRRDDSFVRREIGYALALRKPIIPLIFEDTVPPIHIINVTRVDFTRQTWETAMHELAGRLRREHQHVDQTYAQITPPADPYRDYLNALYQSIVRYLQQTVFSLVTLRGEATPDAVEASPVRGLPMAFFQIAGIGEEQPNRFDSFPSAFEQYNGRALLLGDPGAGKTTTLMAFARDAVTRRLNDPLLPLPILAPIATWDARQNTPLADWLVAQNPVMNGMGLSTMIADGKTLLLLDGLDELDGKREDQPDLHDPRLRFLQLLPTNNQIVLTCRIKDYAQIEQKAMLEGAVTLQPLDDNQMRAYMGDLPDLWAALETDSALREVARTPLLLSLFMFAFNGLADEAKKLRDLTRGDLRDTIFETYVRRRYAYEARKKRTPMPFTLDEIYRVLGQLAVEDIGGVFVRENVLKQADFAGLLGDRTQAFIDLGIELHLLVPGEGTTFRFIHLLLRDYFGFKYALDHLYAEDKMTRIQAVYALGELGEERALEPFIKALTDNSGSIRSQAAYGLGKLGDKRAVEPLIAALQDTSSHVRRNAVMSLSQLQDKRAVEPLLALLTDADRLIRRSAADALGKLADARAVEALITLLTDSDHYVRMSAATALGSIHDPRAIEPLVACLGSEDAYIRSSATRALLDFGEAAIRPLLRARYSDNKSLSKYAQEVLEKFGVSLLPSLIVALGDAEADIRSPAAAQLRYLNEPHTVNLLIDTLNDVDAGVRISAAYALGWMGDKRAVQALMRLLTENDLSVRYTAAGALARLGDESAFDPLVEAMSSPDPDIRRKAADMLGELADPRGLDALVNALHDTDAKVRVSAADALVWLKDERAVPPLIAALEDLDAEVRISVVGALSLIGTPEALAAVTEYRQRTTKP